MYNTKTGTMLTYEPPFPEPTYDYDTRCKAIECARIASL